jgi:uncharacterized alpha-E superfamily protein
MLSRVADTLYWLGRYIERAENNARILDVNLQVTLDDDNAGDIGDKRDWEPILATLEDQKLFNSLYAVTNAETVCEFVTFAKENPNSIRSCCGDGAGECAHRAGIYLERDVGADQQPVSLAELLPARGISSPAAASISIGRSWITRTSFTARPTPP